MQRKGESASRILKTTEQRHLYENNWVFPKWLSLNSYNSVNHDKTQGQYGYYRHSISDNRYIPCYSGKKNFPLLSVDWYLFRVVSSNRYLPSDILCITSTGNVFVTRWVIPLVTISLLDFVMFHWIRWIQRKSFRENTNRNVTTCSHFLFLRLIAV